MLGGTILSLKHLSKKTGDKIFAWAEDRFTHWLTNWEWIRIRVDMEMFESAKKSLRIQKYLDTCGRGLNEYKATKLNTHLLEVCSAETNPVFSVSYRHTYRHDNLELKPAQRCMESMGLSFVAVETDIIEVFDSLAGNKGRKIKTRMLCDHSMQSSILLSFPHIFQN